MVDIVQSRDFNQAREMPTAATTPEQERVHEEKTSAVVVSGGSLAEALCGVAAIMLAIVSLAGVFPISLGAIAAIVLGAGLVLEGLAIGARFTNLLQGMSGSRIATAELGGGLSAEFLAGAAGIVLGILALVGIAPVTLLWVTSIVFGGALLLEAGATARLNNLIVEHRRAPLMARQLCNAMVTASAGAQVLIRLAAIVLGIVGLAGVYPLTLSMVAFLCAGAAVTLSGGALSTKMFKMVNR
jgi:hypothetical protein